MINELINALSSEMIKDYKIIQTKTKVEEFQLVYGNEKNIVNESTKVNIYFYWDNSIKELSVEGYTPSIINLIRLLKKIPSNKCDNNLIYDKHTNIMNSQIKEYNYLSDFEFAKKKFKVLEKLNDMNKKYNLVLTRTEVSMTLCTPSYKLKQYLIKNNINYLDLKDYNNYYNIHFEGNGDYLNKLINRMKDDFNFINSSSDLHQKKVIIKACAFANILNEIVELFHASNFFLKNSIFNTKVLTKRICKEEVSLISIPYKNIIFDSEGNFTQKKYLIKKGCLSNILSNTNYINKLDGILPGDANIINSSEISSQRIVFKVNYLDFKNASSIRILSYHHQKTVHKYLYGIVNYRIGNKIMKTNITINFLRLLNTVNYITKNLTWVSNVLTTDVICNI